MAKKPSAKASKKPARRTAKAQTSKRSAPAKAAPAKSKVKYAQAGAPWWKQFLPG